MMQRQRGVRLFVETSMHGVHLIRPTVYRFRLLCFQDEDWGSASECQIQNFFGFRPFFQQR